MRYLNQSLKNSYNPNQTDQFIASDILLNIYKMQLMAIVSFLQRFALKPKPRKILKMLQSNAFKIFLVVLLIGNSCKTKKELALRANSFFV
jgi:hypothetical protein